MLMLAAFPATGSLVCCIFLLARIGRFVRRYVVKYEGNAIFTANVHHAVLELIVQFIDPPDLQGVRLAFDREADARIRSDGDVNAVTHVKGLQ